MIYVVSACLLGQNCKYNGGSNHNSKLIAFLSDKEYIAVCPEQLGGLSTPRSKCEIYNGKVWGQDGKDVTKQFHQGARKAMKQARKAQIAILQSRSPSCGVHIIYDGSFQKKLVNGNGIFIEYLKRQNIQCYDVIDFIKDRIDQKNV